MGKKYDLVQTDRLRYGLLTPKLIEVLTFLRKPFYLLLLSFISGPFCVVLCFLPNLNQILIFFNKKKKKKRFLFLQNPLMLFVGIRFCLD